jgi:phospholipase D
MKVLHYVGILLFIARFAAAPAFGGAVVDGTIEDISRHAYLPAVQAALNAATGSIDVAMFQIRVRESTPSTQPVRKLVDALVNAHRRGVRVSVVLDRSMRYQDGKRLSDLAANNDNAMHLLQAAGIDVAFGSPGRLMHQKVIIIDDQVVITGSHNWTYHSLTRNTESGELIRSRAYARIKAANIQQIKTVSPVALPPDLTTKIRLSADFITDPAFASTMLTVQDERAFDIYLALQRCRAEGDVAAGGTAGGALFELDYARLAGDLGLDGSVTAYRRQIIRVLRKLQDEYELLEVTFRHGKPAMIQLPPQAVGGRQLALPLAYWSYGLSRQLSLSAKVAYLVCHNELAMSPVPSCWSTSRATLAERYDCAALTIGNGLRELEQLNIIKIVRHLKRPGGSFGQRSPSSHYFVPLRSPEEQAATWQALREKHGAEAVDQACALAEMIDRPNHPDTVEGLLYCLDTYGLARTRKATAAVAATHPSNPMREARNVIAILKRE